MKLKVKKLRLDAQLPTRAHHDDAGADIYCVEAFTLFPGETKNIGSGISIELPEGYVALIWDKSSVGAKGIKTLGGVVDAGYRGEIHVTLHNLTDKEHSFESGQKIAQMLIQKVELWDIEEVDVLNDSARGTGRFGSTGK